MNYLNWLLVPAHLALTLFVIGSCICRVNLLYALKHRFAWVAVYTMFAAFAAGTFFDVLHHRDFFTWFEFIGLLGLVIHLHITKLAWVSGPPQVAYKDFTLPKSKLP